MKIFDIFFPLLAMSFVCSSIALFMVFPRISGLKVTATSTARLLPFCAIQSIMSTFFFFLGTFFIMPIRPIIVALAGERFGMALFFFNQMFLVSIVVIFGTVLLLSMESKVYKSISFDRKAAPYIAAFAILCLQFPGSVAACIYGTDGMLHLERIFNNFK